MVDPRQPSLVQWASSNDMDNLEGGSSKKFYSFVCFSINVTNAPISPYHRAKYW